MVKARSELVNLSSSFHVRDQDTAARVVTVCGWNGALGLLGFLTRNLNGNVEKYESRQLCSGVVHKLFYTSCNICRLGEIIRHISLLSPG